MAVSKGKKSVAVTMNKTLLDRLDAYCRQVGISKSAYISTAVARQLDIETKTTDGMIDWMKAFTSEIMKQQVPNIDGAEAAVKTFAENVKPVLYESSDNSGSGN